MIFQNKYLLLLPAIIMASFLYSCDTGKETEKAAEETIVADSVDVHTYAQPNDAKVTHLDLDITVDFHDKIINGIATWTLEVHDTDTIIFDVVDLDIEKVFLGNGKETGFKLGTTAPFMGQPLYIAIPAGTKKIAIHYRSKPESEALQWLSPEQTYGKEYPFLYTQSEAIMARSWIPCQDSPGIKYTYTATVHVDPDLMAVMSATNTTQKNDEGVYSFKMAQPIPSYLMALAVGDLAFGETGPRTGVYAEPGLLDKAIYEFGDTEKMIAAAEALFGPYRWERYDLLVLPPSFPFGGMENPRLTFVTPTILAGDRSLTSLIAHELAHSWSGNLVTNATWNDFWLNEGFTVYLERRIMDSLYGSDYADMLAVLGYQDLELALEELPAADTKLKLDLAGRNPDDGMSDIAYEKGDLFLLKLSQVYGKKEMDDFLKGYFDAFAFKNLTTSDFIIYMDSNLIVLDTLKRGKVKPEKWIYEAGLPENAPKPVSTRFQEVSSSLKAWTDGSFTLNELETDDWSAHEWIAFIRFLPDSLSVKRFRELDDKFHFTQSNNDEILAIWLEKSIEHHYGAIDKKLEEFLTTVGRRKFLVPLYKALLKAHPDMARSIYKKARPNYHSISRDTLDKLLAYN